MRLHNPRFLISGLALVTLLLSVAALVGCGSWNDGDSDDDANGGGVAISAMKKLPKDAGGFTFIDLAATRADDDIAELYDHAVGMIESECDALGISTDDVDRVADGDTVKILEGSFDLDQVRQELEANGYEADRYKEIDTWEKSHADIEAVALVSESCIVVGSSMDRVKDCIDVIKGNADSLGDDKEVSEIVGRLPTALWVDVRADDSGMGFEAYGWSAAKKDSSTVLVTHVFLFDDEPASDVVEGIVDAYKQGYKTDKVEAKQDGRFVTVTVEQDIDDMFN
jgi:hypothetical protein